MDSLLWVTLLSTVQGPCWSLCFKNNLLAIPYMGTATKKSINKIPGLLWVASRPLSEEGYGCNCSGGDVIRTV